jgi:isocitrate/isopropylmalate dehydrogenase
VARYKVVRMPGDGVGVDVMEAAVLVLERIGLDAEYLDAEIGWTCWERDGNALPEKTVGLLEEADCGLFGAITSKPGVPGYRSPIVGMRQRFNLYVNLRPCKAFPGNPLNYRDDVDLVVFRENTEGLYSGVEFHPAPEAILALDGMERFRGEDTAVSLRVFTRKACHNILKAAFEYAREHGRRRVTAVHKANVVRQTCGMFLEEAEKLAADYPEIDFDSANVDAMAMWLIKDPQDYDVLVTSNLFGDIISDEAAQLVGGLGFASSGNIGNDLAVFEPTHGSAPKYAGQYRVNPTAMLLASRLMLEYLGEEDASRALENGIGRVIREGRVRTKDMGGNASTLEMARAVADALG